jgi:acyl carrier protein
MTVKEEVLRFFKADALKPLPDDTEADYLSCHYLDIGMIDSMGIVKMITEFEEKFDIHFDADCMQSYEFQTIGGLIKIIERLKGKKNEQCA